MHHSIWNLKNIGFAALVLAGLIVLAIEWQKVLFALVLALVVGTTLAIVLCVPTFLVSLCWEQSFGKAWKRTCVVAFYCLACGAKLLDHAI